jgi:surface antigen
MKTPRIAVVLVATLTAVACAQDAGQKETAGTLVGAGLGGLAGSQIGSGSGKLAAVGAGVLLGGLLGRSIGRSLDAADRAYMAETQQHSLEYERTGTTSQWQNPDSGHSGTFTPTKYYESGTGQPCREYTQTVVISGRQETAYGTACREADGTWRIVN